MVEELHVWHNCEKTTETRRSLYFMYQKWQLKDHCIYLYQKKKEKRRKKRLRNWIRKDDWRVTIFNCIWEDHWRMTVFNCGRKVTVITWCFMPSQPLQLYQGECQKKHTLKNQCIRKSSWRNFIFWKDGWRIIVYNCIRKTAEGSLYVNVWERHLEDHCT